MSDAPAHAVVDIENLSVVFKGEDGDVQALSGVSMRAEQGEIVGIVGESGSGKSVTAMTLIRLLPNNARMSGRVRLLGRDVLAMTPAQLRRMRGSEAAYIFQEPMSALNPTKRIGRQLTDVIHQHTGDGRLAAIARAERLLHDMRIADVGRIMRAYPFELSGGMRQRILIAMAFSCNPRLIIADEPTTALDVSVQAQVLALLIRKARETGAAVLFISHDLALVSQICSRFYVMCRGVVVEHGDASRIIASPQRPYTRALLDALPERGQPRQALRTSADLERPNAE